MKEKSNYKVVDVLSEDFDKNDRIEWLKQLYAEWLGKRRVILNYNNIFLQKNRKVVLFGCDFEKITKNNIKQTRF